jgi:hypothetical protein
MSKNSKPISASRSKTLSRLFGPPPILEGEDPAVYAKFLADVSAYVKPTNIIEKFWIRDVVDLTWEIIRLRNFKTSFLNGNAFLENLDIIERIERLIMTYEIRRNAALREIDRHRTHVAEILRQKIREAEAVEYKLCVESKSAELKKVA